MVFITARPFELTLRLVLFVGQSLVEELALQLLCVAPHFPLHLLARALLCFFQQPMALNLSLRGADALKSSSSAGSRNSSLAAMSGSSSSTTFVGAAPC
eukprot:160606-Amphidinium_carterae.2